MRTVDMHEAQTQLSQLVDEAAKGEPFVIARAGKPLVTVMAIEQHSVEDKPVDTSKRFGFMAGQGFEVPDDFDTMFETEIEDMFYGEPDQS